jgi:hypothetical protein
MLFGHNTNVQVGDTAYHVQTEDRGTTNALIDTTVYFRGRVLHRRTNNYLDLLPLDPAREQALKLRVDQQHRAIVEEIRTGALALSRPRDEKASPPGAAPAAAASSNTLQLELLNAKTWLSGKKATLYISVRDNQKRGPVSSARVAAHVHGAAEAHEYVTECGSDGLAQMEFDMPRLTGPEPALVIDASKGSVRGHLRFQLRARPRVPSAS